MHRGPSGIGKGSSGILKSSLYSENGPLYVVALSEILNL